MRLTSPLIVKKINHPEFVSIHVYKNADDVGLSAAMMVVKITKTNPKAHICCNTGKTPQPMYQSLVKLYKKKLFDPINILWSHLDERAGFAPDDKDSFVREISKVWDRLNIPADHRHIIRGDQKPNEVITKLNEFLTSHPRDLTMLGLGIDSHIAFLMPGDPLWRRAHFVKKLSDHVIHRDLERTGRILKSGYTMGIYDIIESRQILMLATGKEKAQAVKKMLYEKMSPTIPSSYIRKNKNAIVLLDVEAASEI